MHKIVYFTFFEKRLNGERQSKKARRETSVGARRRQVKL